VPARTVLALTLLALLLAAPAASASHTKGKCRGGKTLSQNSVARLYESGSSLIGCMWSRNERVDLDSEYDDDYTLSYGWSTPRLGGRFAAWVHHEEDVSCKAECPPGYGAPTYRIQRTDLKSEDTEGVEGLPAGSTLRVNKRGALTWLESLGGGRREVHAWDRDGHRVLDTGPISSKTYSLRGSVLRWTNGDVSHVVTLR
jgi:hypothetical protein